MRLPGFDHRIDPWATPHAPSLLKVLWLPQLWNAAPALRRAARAMVEVTIAAAGSHGGCVRSLKICDRAHTPHAAQGRPRTQSHAGAWAGWRQEGARP
jgi:hypothetical protein